MRRRRRRTVGHGPVGPGLTGLSERVAAAGGALEVDAARGGGTAVTAPLGRAGRSAAGGPAGPECGR